jgi:muconate cycloisomerase
VDAVRALVGDGVTLRVDANMAWSAEEADAHVEGLLDRGVTYVEQPLPAEARDATVALAARWPNRILLDESLVSPQDLDTFVEAGAPIRALWKVGKNGGPLATLRLARAAEDAGIPCHLGAHVGESSLLSAAGRLVGGRGRFETLEGSFGALLLERDLTDPPLSFGPGGVAPTAWSDGPGWGFDVVLGD